MHAENAPRNTIMKPTPPFTLLIAIVWKFTDKSTWGSAGWGKKSFVHTVDVPHFVSIVPPPPPVQIAKNAKCQAHQPFFSLNLFFFFVVFLRWPLDLCERLQIPSGFGAVPIGKYEHSYKGSSTMLVNTDPFVYSALHRWPTQSHQSQYTNNSGQFWSLWADGTKETVGGYENRTLRWRYVRHVDWTCLLDRRDEETKRLHVQYHGHNRLFSYLSVIFGPISCGVFGLIR